MNQETIEQIIWDGLTKQDIPKRHTGVRLGVSSAAQALAAMWPQQSEELKKAQAELADIKHLKELYDGKTGLRELIYFWHKHHVFDEKGQPVGVKPSPEMADMLFNELSSENEIMKEKLKQIGYILSNTTPPQTPQ